MDMIALLKLAAVSPSRERLIASGFRSMLAYADLHEHGYQVRHWLRLRDFKSVLEYHPRIVENVSSNLLRVTACDYEETHGNLPLVWVREASHRRLSRRSLGCAAYWTTSTFDPARIHARQ